MNSYDSQSELCNKLADAQKGIAQLKADIEAGMDAAAINAKHNIFVELWGDVEPAALLAEMEQAYEANRRLLSKILGQEK